MTKKSVTEKIPFEDGTVEVTVPAFNRIEHDPIARLIELKKIAGKDGWNWGDGKALDKPGVDWLIDFFRHNYPKELPNPYIYPGNEGGVQLEWEVGNREMFLRIVDLLSHKGTVTVYDADEELDGAEIDLGDEKSRELLFNRVRKLTHPTQEKSQK